MEQTLKTILDFRGLRPSDLAKTTGIPISTVYAHCNGSRRISHKWAVVYAEELDIPIADLLPRPEQPKTT